MRRHVIVLLGIVLLLATSVMTISCLPSSKSNSSQDAPTDSIAYKSSVDAVQKNLDSQTKRIDDLYGKIGSAAAPPDLSGYEKKDSLKSDVNAIIEQYLKDHPVTTTATPTATVPGGTVAWLTNPSSVQTLGSTQVCFTLKVTNSTSQWVYIRPIINVNLHTGQNPLTTPLDANTVVITVGGSSANYIDADFQVTGTTSSAVLIPTEMNGTGTGEFQLGANTTADLLVCVQVTHGEARIWDIVVAANWRSL